MGIDSMVTAIQWGELEAARKRAFHCGWLLILLGITALLGGWSWVSGALAIATGSLIVDTAKSTSTVVGKVTGATGYCGVNASEDDPCCRGSRTCCAPVNATGMLVATIIFAFIDLCWAVPTAALQSMAFIEGRAPPCDGGSSSTAAYADYCNDSAFLRGMAYLGVVRSRCTGWTGQGCRRGRRVGHARARRRMHHLPQPRTPPLLTLPGSAQAWIITCIASGLIIVVAGVALAAWQTLANSTFDFGASYYASAPAPTQIVVLGATPAGYAPAPAGYVYAVATGTGAVAEALPAAPVAGGAPKAV
jgi:hypothetical protein